MPVDGKKEEPDSHRSGAGYGKRSQCYWCQQPIDRVEVEFDLSCDAPGQSLTLFFHHRCHEQWGTTSRL